MVGCSKTSHPKKEMKISSSAMESRVNPLMSTPVLKYPPEEVNILLLTKEEYQDTHQRGRNTPLHNKNLEEFYSSMKKPYTRGTSPPYVRKTLKLNSLFFFVYFRPREPKRDTKCSQTDHGNSNSHARNYSIVYVPVCTHPHSTIKHSKIYVT